MVQEISGHDVLPADAALRRERRSLTSVNTTGLCTSRKAPLAERVAGRAGVLSTAFQQILWKSRGAIVPKV